MQVELPKQYLRIADKTLLELTIECFIGRPDISGIVLVLSKGDTYWPGIASKFPNVMIVDGGDERCQSVLNGLKALAVKGHVGTSVNASMDAESDDWVLVHDAARPCLRRSDIDHLISSLSQHAVGGLLGLPMADTVKCCESNGTVIKTVPRHDLWRALTPQMFRLKQLTVALTQALADKAIITDEASAMEHIGLQPKMVVGHSDNIKITHPEDLVLAKLYLSAREKIACA